MPPLDDLVALAALVLLLVTAFRHPSGRAEMAVGVVAVAATAGTGLLDADLATEALRQLGPVLLFLMSILLPVSNLTNLLALQHLDLGFVAFALTMAPVLGVVLVVEYVGPAGPRRSAGPHDRVGDHLDRVARQPVVAAGPGATPATADASRVPPGVAAPHAGLAACGRAHAVRRGLRRDSSPHLRFRTCD